MPCWLRTDGAVEILSDPTTRVNASSRPGASGARGGSGADGDEEDMRREAALARAEAMMREVPRPPPHVEPGDRTSGTARSMGKTLMTVYCVRNQGI